MNFRAIINIVCFLLIVLGTGMGFCGVVGILYNDVNQVLFGMFCACLFSLVVGVVGAWVTRSSTPLKRLDGFGIVTGGWLAASIAGALPYLLTEVITDPTAAIFEAMSGFSTTGASVLSNLESLPRSVLLWRSATQWFGGMGVLVLCVAILPFLGVGGMQIFRAEMPGPSKDRLTPRIATTAKLFWGVYSLLSLLLFLFLWVGKMDWYESLNHVFTTMATGGFSTRSGSIGAYDSPYIEWVLIVFMLLAGTNFTLHYAALTGRGKPYWRNSEFGTFIIVWAAASIFLALSVWHSEYSDFADALRSACFQSASIMTTTGFATADFDQWSNTCRLLLLVLMFVGGCAGSTGGGIKVVRIMVIFKKAGREIRRFLQPNAVIALRLGNKPLDQNAVSHISAFFVLFMLLFAFFSFIMTFFTPDLETAFSSVVATMANIGPGLSEVGPAETYASIDSRGLIILTLCMLLGRLELYTVLIALLPHFWRNT